MYAFLTGPAVWTALTVFVVGLLVRIVFLIGLSRERDRIVYNHADFSWGLKSILHWIFPWTSVSTRQQPIFALAVFVFHIGLLAVPLFLNAHHILWDEAFGVSLWSMPDAIADTMTVLVMVSGLFLLIRRLIRPEVRILTGAWDYILLILTLTPFISGFLAYHQWGNYEVSLYIHIISAEILLILIPFTKLSHMILFFFTRAFIGFEMGGRRGARAW